jgi:hypothetical protein
MTLADIIEEVQNAAESEEIPMEELEDFEISMVLPEDDQGREGIVSALDVDISRKQGIIKIYVDLV